MVASNAGATIFLLMKIIFGGGGGDAQSALSHRRCRLKPKLSYVVIPRLDLQGDGNLPYMSLRGGQRPTKSILEY